jgi:hypothetical protein
MINTAVSARGGLELFDLRVIKLRIVNLGVITIAF